MALTQFGTKTPAAVIYKHESHKLHQAFPVKSGDTILQGMPVMLNPDGTISPYVGTGIYIGIATNFNSKFPAYPPTSEGVEMTVMVEGFTIVQGKAAAAAQNAGYVAPGAVPTDDIYVPYAAGTNTNFIQINPASDAGDLIQVLVK